MLQLLQTKRKPDGAADEEYGEFLHVPGKRFYNFNDIRKEIQVLRLLRLYYDYNCVSLIVLTSIYRAFIITDNIL